VLVVDRPADPVRADAGPLARFGEAVERGEPGFEAGDRVLDVEGRHAQAGACAFDHSALWMLFSSW
jgi:hypothetical protein